MTIPPKVLRIGGALVIALLFMGTAYVLSGPSFLSARLVGAESTDELLKAYAQKDADNDGLPDWQEELYDTNPSNPDTDGDGVTDGQAATQGLLATQKILTSPDAQNASIESIPGTTPLAGTMTEEFSRVFFESFMGTWNGQPLSQQEQDQLLTSLLARFSSEAEKKLSSSYTSSSVKGSIDVSVVSYAGEVERIIRANEVSEGGNEPVALAKAFIEDGDTSVKPKIAALARAYRGIADGLAATRVPLSLTDEHLMLMRSFDTLALATGAIANYDNDPLAVLGALKLLVPAASDSVTAFKGIAAEIVKSGTPSSGTPGVLILNIAASAQKP